MADNLENEGGEDSSDDLQRVIAELGGDADGCVIRLLRLEKAGARTGAVIADMDPSEFSFMEVKRRFGGGHFRAKLARSNGQLVRNQAFSLEGKPRFEDDTQQVQQVQAPASAPRDADPMLAMMNMQMQMMREQTKENQTFMRDFLVAMRTAQQAAPVAPPPPAFGPQEMIGLIAAMMPLFSQKQTSDPIAALTQGIQLGKEMAGVGGGGDDESALGVLSKGLDTLGPLVQKIASAPPAPPVQHPRHQRPAAPIAPPAPPEIQMTPKQKEVYSMMKMIASAALESAAAGEPPEKLVGQYGAMVPGVYRSALSDPQIVDALVKVEPALDKHRTWLDTMREAFRASYASPLERAEDSGIKVDYGPPAS